MPIYLPSDRQRLLVLGRTGSGKTRAAMWHLSQRHFDRPWIALNHKREQMIAGVPYAQFPDLDQLPTEPGLYVYHPLPGVDDETVTDLLWSVYQRGNTGVYIDEGTMLGRMNPAYNALLTQGRSKGIPMITLSQRPAFLAPYAISEADFFQVFFLTNKKDRQRVGEFIPVDLEPLMTAGRLPEYHSVYYDVARNKLVVFAPVPDDSAILAALAAKLAPPEPEQKRIHLL